MMKTKVTELNTGRSDSWLGFGTRLGEDGDGVTAKDALRTANLDWEVGKRPLAANMGERYKDIPYYGTFREDTGEFMGGIVTHGYHPLQNVEAFAFMDSVLESSGAHYTTAGTINGGRCVWLQAKLPKDFEIAGDVHGNYLLLSNSHDATGSVKVTFTSTRMVCANQLRFALAGSDNETVKVRHTSGMSATLKTAINVMQKAVGHFEKTQEFMEHLAKDQISERDVQNLVYEIVAPGKELKDLTTRTLNTADEIITLVYNGKGNDKKGIRGTSYALLNATTEFDTHHRGVREIEGISVEEKRMARLWFGNSLQERTVKVLEKHLAA